jgi:hypothetical protein
MCRTRTGLVIISTPNRRQSVPANGGNHYPFGAVLAIVVSLLITGGAFAQNVLVNADFETNPPPNFGNNIGYPIPPWTLGAGQTSNVVKVDGPGGADYGINGPESDASAPGPGIAQHYLDIADGENSFHQVFTPRCSGTVQFGGSFSTRANQSGIARVEIHEGNTGLAGPLVGATNFLSLPGGNSKTDPWTNVSFSVPVTAFQTYSFVVFMDNQLNFDNGFVIFNENCPAPDPCCPPWSSTSLEEMLVYHGTGGIVAPYTLQFQPTSGLSNQMQAYINYLNSVNPAITQITIQFRLHDGGTGTSPVTGAQMGASHFITWQAGLTTGPFPTPTFFSGVAETMVVNRWYVIHTGIFLENNQTFFGDSCANNDVAVRVQVQSLSRTIGAVATLMFRDATGRVMVRPLASVR